MKNHDIMFDKREKRIGFVQANCSINIPEWIIIKPGKIVAGVFNSYIV